MKAAPFTALVAVSVGLLVGCSKKAAPDPQVLAQVGPLPIRVQDLQKEIEWRQKNHRPIPNARAVLDDLIAQETLFQQAQAAGLPDDPEVQRAFRNVLITKLKERQLTPKVDGAQAAPEEIEARYREQITQHTRPAKARLAVIHLKTDAKLSEERAMEVRARVDEARRLTLELPKGSQGFAGVAAQFSEDQASRYKGGDIGWFDQGAANYRWPAKVVSAGFALPQRGDVSEVIGAEGGLYLVMKLDTREAVVTPLAQVEESLRRRISSEKRQQVEQDFMQQMRQRAGVKVFPEAIAQVPVLATTMARRADPEPPGLP